MIFLEIQLIQKELSIRTKLEIKRGQINLPMFYLRIKQQIQYQKIVNQLQIFVNLLQQQKINKQLILNSVASDKSSFIINISTIAFLLFFASDNPALAKIVNDCTINSITQAETQFISFERCLAFAKVEHKNGQKQNQILSQIGLKLETFKQIHQLLKIEKTIISFKRSKFLQQNQKKRLHQLVELEQENLLPFFLFQELLKSQMVLLYFIELIYQPQIQNSLENPSQLFNKIPLYLKELQVHQHADQELNDVALQCCLEDLLLQKSGLDTEILEKWDNLSAGEKQHIFIARAILKQSQIILIDEIENQKIQQTIQTAFKKCTVITIAHRINTIIHSDKILAIVQGKVKEFDEPQNLLNDKSSIFYSFYLQGKKSNKI